MDGGVEGKDQGGGGVSGKMGVMPKVSVIMPTYNRAWIIKRAIESVLKQTFGDWELVVIDDGSTDDTQELLLGIKDKRLVVQSQANRRGAAAARNAGLKRARGELIAYLDSDNLWYANFLEVMVGELVGRRVLVYSGQNTLLASGSKSNLKIIGRKVRNSEYNPARMIYENFIDINSVVHKREILDEVGYFDESLRTLEDWDLFARIVLRYPFGVKHVDQVLGEYYFFLKETAETVENSFSSQEWLLDSFGVREIEGDERKIVGKIHKLLGMR